MCGRFASARKRAELAAEFRVERDRVTEPLEPDYNVAPTKPVYAVLTRRQREGAGEGGAAGGPGALRHDGAGRAARETERAPPDGAVRELRAVRWGLVPSWAKDPAIGSRLINARAETVASKPAFRQAFTRRRCLIPADGFYEWVTGSGQGRSRKQPYYIYRSDGGILAFAGLYEIWRDARYPADHPWAWLWTTVIITTQAQDDVGRIHDRMPMIIEAGRWDDWLDPASSDPLALRSLLAPASAARLTSHPVATDVNNVRNNGPGLIRPLPPEAGR
jgi:putative SOS response-associated peptidase YedK